MHRFHKAQERTDMGKIVSGSLLFSARDKYNNENTEWVLRRSDTGPHLHLLSGLYFASY